MTTEHELSLERARLFAEAAELVAQLPYFMEMNSRIQVEHPVTEMVTGIDLIRAQILIDSGQPLGFSQQDVRFSGAAVECLINAEDPARGFAPGPGRLVVFAPPSGPWTRVDSGYLPGMQVTPYYDALLAKLIVWAPDRNEALARMDRALAEVRVEGLSTTIDFHRAVLADPLFRAGKPLDRLRRSVHGRPRGRVSRPGSISLRGLPSLRRSSAMPAMRLTIEDLMEILVTKVGLPRDGVSADPFATFGDMGLDSLAYLQLQAAIADNYGFELDDDLLHGTLGEILALINEGLAAREGLHQ